MKILKKPELKINEIVTTCIENYSDEDLKKRFLESLRGLEESAVKYDSVAEKGHLHLFPTHDNFSSLTGEELKKLYTDKFSKKRTKWAEIL